jgi:hypothetical protein
VVVATAGVGVTVTGGGGGEEDVVVGEEENLVAVTVTVRVIVEGMAVVRLGRVTEGGSVALGSSIEVVPEDVVVEDDEVETAAGVALGVVVGVAAVFVDEFTVTMTMLGVNLLLLLPLIIRLVEVVRVTDGVVGCTPGVVPFSSPGRIIVCLGASPVAEVPVGEGDKAEPLARKLEDVVLKEDGEKLAGTEEDVEFEIDAGVEEGEDTRGDLRVDEGLGNGEDEAAEAGVEKEEVGVVDTADVADGASEAELGWRGLIVPSVRAGTTEEFDEIFELLTAVEEGDAELAE